MRSSDDEDIDDGEEDALVVGADGIFYMPCVFNPHGVSEAVCRSTSGVLQHNNRCCGASCGSKARVCRTCVLQGITPPGTVVNRNHGLCSFHEASGENARPVAEHSLAIRRTAPAPTTRELTVRAPEVVRVQETIVPSVSVSERQNIMARVSQALRNGKLIEVDPKKIRPMPGQPRKYFDPERLERLADSFRSTGQIMPGFLRIIPRDEHGHEFELVDGERRWRVSSLVNQPYRAIAFEIDGSDVPYVISVIANFHRAEHTTMEISDAVKHMMEVLNMSQAEIGESLGFHPVYISRFYSLQRLTGEVRDMLDPNLRSKDKLLPRSAAFELVKMAPFAQIAAANDLLAGRISMTELRMRHNTENSDSNVRHTGKHSEPGERWRALYRRVEAIDSKLDDFVSVMNVTPLPVSPGLGHNAVLTKKLLKKLEQKIASALEQLEELP